MTRTRTYLLDSLTDWWTRHDREPAFSFIPITWEELDWEFPRCDPEVL